MDEETTTQDVSQDESGANAQPVEQQQEADNTDQNDQQQEQDSSNEPETNSSDNSKNQESKEATEDWMRSKGLDPEDPEAFKKAANMAYNSEKLMSRTQQKSTQLEQQVSTQPFEQVSNDPLVQQMAERTAQLELTMNVNDWKRDNAITPEQDLAIGDYLRDNPQKAYMLKNGYLNLDDVASMSGATRQDAQSLKSAGSRETLEKLANQQRASAPTGNAATTAAPQALTKANVESWYESLGSKGRQDPANQAKLDAVLGS